MHFEIQAPLPFDAHAAFNGGDDQLGTMTHPRAFTHPLNLFFMIVEELSFRVS